MILPDLEMAVSDLTKRSPAAEGPRDAAAGPPYLTEDLSLKEVSAQAAEEAERRLLRRVLGETRWNRKQAACQLKISYKALLNKLKKWEVEELGEERARDEPDPRAAGASRGGAGKRLERLM